MWKLPLLKVLLKHLINKQQQILSHLFSTNTLLVQMLRTNIFFLVVFSSQEFCFLFFFISRFHFLFDCKSVLPFRVEFLIKYTQHREHEGEIRMYVLFILSVQFCSLVNFLAKQMILNLQGLLSLWLQY